MKVIKYKTGEDLDFIAELDKIWWDHLADDPSYQVSMVNVDVLDNPTIRNAYSYQVKGDRIYYSIITGAPFKEKIHRTYESLVLGHYVYDFKVIDEHTYSINHFPYQTEHPMMTAEKLLYQIGLFELIPPTHDVGIEVLDEWVYKALAQIEERRAYGVILRLWYESNKQRILKEQSFAQGNCQLGRIQHLDNLVFFDYFSVYERPAYLSWMLDLATLLLSLYNERPNDSKVIKFITETLNDHQHEKDMIIFLAMLQEECYGNRFFEALWTRNRFNQEFEQ